MRLSKRIAAGVLSAMLAMSMLAGCGGTPSNAASSGSNASSGNNTSTSTSTGNNNANNSNSSANSELENVLKTVTWANSKTNQYFKVNGATSSKCYLDGELISSTQKESAKIAANGDNLYFKMDVTFNGQIAIYKGNTLYALNSKDKTYWERSTIDNEYNDTRTLAKLFVTIPTETTVSPTIITSKERLYGQIYDRETFRINGLTYSYCYEGTELRYILFESLGYVMKVNKLTASPDSKLFEIPEGYTKTN